MEQEFSFKEFYDVTLNAIQPFTLNGRDIEPGEVIAAFDSIRLANFNEVKNRISAYGGYENKALVTWDISRELQLQFDCGIFSKEQFTLLTNSNLVSKPANQYAAIPQRECLETDEDGFVVTKYEPSNNEPLFCYRKNDGKKLQIEKEDGNKLLVKFDGTPEIYTNVIIDYIWECDTESSVMIIGDRLFPGFVELRGKTRTQDDITGKIKTAYIVIPKLKIISNFRVTLGKGANPVSGMLTGIANQIGEGWNKHFMEIAYLNDDVDQDIE